MSEGDFVKSNQKCATCGSVMFKTASNPLLPLSPPIIMCNHGHVQSFYSFVAKEMLSVKPLPETQTPFYKRLARYGKRKKG